MDNFQPVQQTMEEFFRRLPDRYKGGDEEFKLVSIGHFFSVREGECLTDFFRLL